MEKDNTKKAPQLTAIQKYNDAVSAAMYALQAVIAERKEGDRLRVVVRFEFA